MSSYRQSILKCGLRPDFPPKFNKSPLSLKQLALLESIGKEFEIESFCRHNRILVIWLAETTLISMAKQHLIGYFRAEECDQRHESSPALLKFLSKQRLYLRDGYLIDGFHSCIPRKNQAYFIIFNQLCIINV